ncbi:unnamed protein product [Euphydryas editha]|uniref:Phosphatidylethanolamine-binding protein n=2 Tax=Euphydryas editha TaxID=104508 RepID=A0AAU9TFB2_EUPED|nr:unnamed protein product [Euphydryas editha]
MANRYIFLSTIWKLISMLIIIRVQVCIATQQCAMVDVKGLLEGCDRLVGLNITSVGGTMVNDHNCDVLLPKQVFIEEPLYQYVLADSKKFYTILMVDPDAAPQLEGEFYLHMIKSNIPGVALKAKETSKTVGIDYRGYKPPTPPRGSGVHRYLNLLYEQADGNNFLPSVPSSRGRFHLANWLRGKNLCGPIAATQFRVQY